MHEPIRLDLGIMIDARAAQPAPSGGPAGVHDPLAGEMGEEGLGRRIRQSWPP